VVGAHAHGPNDSRGTLVTLQRGGPSQSAEQGNALRSHRSQHSKSDRTQWRQPTGCTAVIGLAGVRVIGGVGARLFRNTRIGRTGARCERHCWRAISATLTRFRARFSGPGDAPAVSLGRRSLLHLRVQIRDTLCWLASGISAWASGGRTTSGYKPDWAVVELGGRFSARRTRQTVPPLGSGICRGVVVVQLARFLPSCASTRIAGSGILLNGECEAKIMTAATSANSSKDA